MICEEMGVLLKVQSRISNAEVPFWYDVLFKEFEQRVVSLRVQQFRQSTPSAVPQLQQEIIDRLPGISNP
jgi:hypothetical protein